MQDFSSLPQTLSAALHDKGYSNLTPVQASVLDENLRGKDLLVSAQTGSGKTVGFGLAIAPDLLDESGRFGRPEAPLAVVIAPTRELALQVRREFDWLFAQAGIVTASAVGGMDTRTERRALERGAHVVVATPGRLRDHAARGNIDLGSLRAVVLDEADEMLDMGFAEDLEFILDQTPENRRTLMFSATVPQGISKLAQTHQKSDAERLVVGSSGSQHADITYSALTVAPSDIEKAIINLLSYHGAQTAIIFANTRSMVARLTAKFSNRGFRVASLSGELSQTERSNAMQALRDGRANVCVATDVAARGIDLPGLDLVIHADLPSNAETLLHRSGRTGRAGRKGRSILIVPARQRGKAQRLLRAAKLDASWDLPPSAEEVLAREEERMIAGPAFTDPPSPEESAFAERLLEGRTAQQIAAAYLRLYREHHSAPEILGAPQEPGKRDNADRAAFGPSTWFSLSLGRKHRAEPRWLLPMLCRNAGLEKRAIGAIRVQYQETFVEIANDAIAAMKQELGEGLALEQGAALTELDGAPDFDASPKGPPSGPRPGGDRPKHKQGRPDDRDGDRKRGGARDGAKNGTRDGGRDRTGKAAGDRADNRAKSAEGKGKPAPKPNKGAGAGKGAGKGNGKPQPPSKRPPASQDKKPRGAAPKAPHGGAKPHGKPAAKPATASSGQDKRPKHAADSSKSLRSDKSRHTSKRKSNGARPPKHTAKGGEARPFRKPPKKA